MIMRCQHHRLDDLQKPDAAAYLKSTTVMGVDQPDPAAQTPMFATAGKHEVPAWIGPYSRTCA